MFKVVKFGQRSLSISRALSKQSIRPFSKGSSLLNENNVKIPTIQKLDKEDISDQTKTFVSLEEVTKNLEDSSIKVQELEPSDNVNESQLVEEVEDDPDWFLNEEIEGEQTVEEVFVPKWMKAAQESSKIGNEDQEYEISGSEPAPGLLTHELILKFLFEQRAQDVIQIDMKKKCDWTESMYVIEGTSLRHLQAMSERVRIFVKACQKFDKSIPDTLSLEGEMNDEWIVLDGGKIVFHFMTKSARDTYQLEKLWKNFVDPNIELRQQIEKDPAFLSREDYLKKVIEDLEGSSNKTQYFENEDEVLDFIQDKKPETPQKSS